MSGARTGPVELGQRLADLWAEQAGGACPEDEALAGYLDPAAPAEARADFERHLAGCAECRAVIESHAVAADAWRTASLTEQDASVGAWVRVRAWFAGPRLWAAAAAACLAVVAAVWLTPIGPPPDGLRPKGAWRLHAAAQIGDRTFRLSDDRRLPSGARLGFFYSAEQAGQLMVLYAGEAGEIVRLVPGQSDRSLEAPAGQEVRLADGAVLSPGQGCEWVVALFSARPFSESEARRAARRMLDARQGCQLDPSRAGLTGVDVQVIRVQR